MFSWLKFNCFFLLQKLNGVTLITNLSSLFNMNYPRNPQKKRLKEKRKERKLGKNLKYYQVGDLARRVLLMEENAVK